jgi:NAD(P)-dependent dehydrogenase (short-subunit alcohol dehydrogenase family)
MARIRSLATAIASMAMALGGLALGPVIVGMVSDRLKSELGMIPLGRWGRRSEIGGVAVFLASRASSYLTGSTIVIDGGLSLHHPLHMVAE